MLKLELSKFIKTKLKEVGFDLCGITNTDLLESELPYLNNWLKKSYNADMHYMERNIDKRVNPALLVEETKSIIVVGLNYYNEFKADTNKPQFSKYAYGMDYHYVVKSKLEQVFNEIKKLNPNAQARWFTDSAPILERKLAQKAGLGWIGKNSMLINKQFGSYIFLGELFINIELDYDNEFEGSFCGNCASCISACPTSAIVDKYIVNANKCISYLTIENKEAIPDKHLKAFSNQVFGCDICQEVCPWNKKLNTNCVDEFKINQAIKSYTFNDWKKINPHQFSEIFKASAVKRTKYKGFMRNMEYLYRTKKFEL